MAPALLFLPSQMSVLFLFHFGVTLPQWVLRPRVETEWAAPEGREDGASTELKRDSRSDGTICSTGRRLQTCPRRPTFRLPPTASSGAP